MEHNYELMNHLEEFRLFEVPVLVGISRKSMIYKLLGITPDDSLNGTSILNTIALTKGANILRVHDVKEAVEHINEHGTKHSEAIITENRENAEYFANYVDASSVYLNASTRFTDGEEFGLGAEIGISTQKLHARGPMGLEALTTIKYKIVGNGQIRN